MARNRRSARDAGTRFETLIARHLANTLGDDRIERRTKTGSKDRGDIGGIRTPHGGRVVVECKNVSRLALAQWVDEADTERGNDDALVGLVIHKRHGVGDPGVQYVTMTVDDLVALLSGSRPADADPCHGCYASTLPPWPQSTLVTLCPACAERDWDARIDRGLTIGGDR